MKLTFTRKPISDAPSGTLRIRLTEEARGTQRIVREGKTDWLELGAGKAAEMTRRKFITLCRSIVQSAKAQNARRIAVQFDLTPSLFTGMQGELSDATKISELAALNVTIAAFEPDSHKSKPTKGKEGEVVVLEEILVCGATDKAVEAAAKKGQTIGEAVNACRELANAPGGHLTPEGLAKAAKQAVAGLPVTVSTLNRAQLTKAGMGLLAGVGAGSQHGPTFTVLTYNGGAKSAKPIVLAGKGITFDSGGMNLKPSGSIYEMHMDMAGGAAVIHAVALAARLKLKKNVVALIPSAENMLGSGAVRPGDILTSLSGKTVEVTDTDAEGRLVLADALTYAKRLKPSVVIDVATLTGAAMIALGHYATGVMTRDDKLSELLIAQGEATGEYLWRLPLWDEYEPVVKSDFADLQNHSISGGRWGGATNGAIFLWQFAKELDCPWAHLDIAPRMVSVPGDELAKGATGVGVALLTAFIESWKS